MRDADERAEARAKRAHDFVGQRDLGHHDQNIAPGRERARSEIQVDLGLAAGGDSPQQKRLVAAMLDGRRDRVERDLLLIGEIELCRRDAVSCRGCRVERNQPAAREAFQHRARAVNLDLQIRDSYAGVASSGDCVENLALLRAPNSLDARARDQSCDQVGRIAMPSCGGVSPLEDALGDEARNGGTHFARRTDFLELARRRGALCDRLDDRSLDARESCPGQRVGRSREDVGSPRLDPGDRGNHAAVGVRNRHHVVGREELHQLQVRAIEQRARLEHFENGLQLARREPLADLGDDARHLARAQRREHAMARLDQPVERRRNRIR